MTEDALPAAPWKRRAYDAREALRGRWTKRVGLGKSNWLKTATRGGLGPRLGAVFPRPFRHDPSLSLAGSARSLLPLRAGASQAT